MIHMMPEGASGSVIWDGSFKSRTIGSFHWLTYPILQRIPVRQTWHRVIFLVVRFQHRYYVPLALFCGFVVPVFIASLWDDYWGGLLYAGHVTKLMTWHTTFCINSFAHWLGSQDYSLEFTARGNLLLALMTNGEGMVRQFTN